MKLSYWEYQTWLSNIDFTIVGSGIVGLNCAINLKSRFPNAKIIVLERGILPNGASTKNAGFACFGSLSEILDDLQVHNEEEVLELVMKRMEGLHLLRENLGDNRIEYLPFGGNELFRKEDERLFEECIAKREDINKLLNPVFKEDVFSLRENNFGFKKIQDKYIYNKFEGQLNTGKMMSALLHKAQQKGIKILNNIAVEAFSDANDQVKVVTNEFEFSTNKLLIATNGFAEQLGIPETRPARAQVLITRPIPELSIKGTFHLQKGYYYFRNIHNRILLGGGRNLDEKNEQTTGMAETTIIQDQLEKLLREIILPDSFFEVAQRWSGIMGVGGQKKPILRQLSNNVFCGVRLGGMGVAVGSLVGKELAELV